MGEALWYTSVSSKALALIVEKCGIVQQRPICGVCQEPLDDGDIRVRAYTGKRAYEYLGVEFHHAREQVHWRCSRRSCKFERAVGAKSEVWQEGYTLRQNVGLILQWARAAEPSSEELARDAFLDHGQLVCGWLEKTREVIAYVQARENEVMELGGPGVEVQSWVSPPGYSWV